MINTASLSWAYHFRTLDVTKMGLAIGVKMARMVTRIEIGVRLGSGKLRSGLESKVSKEIVVDSGQKSGPRCFLH